MRADRPAALLAAYANDSVRSPASRCNLHVSAPPLKASIYRIGFGGKGGTKVAETRGDKRLFTGKQVDPTTRAVSRWLAGRHRGRHDRMDLGLHGGRRTSDGGTNIPFVVRLPPKRKVAIPRPA